MQSAVSNAPHWLAQAPPLSTPVCSPARIWCVRQPCHCEVRPGRQRAPRAARRRTGSERAENRRLQTVDDSIHRAAIVSHGVRQRRSNGVLSGKKVSTAAAKATYPGKKGAEGRAGKWETRKARSWQIRKKGTRRSPRFMQLWMAPSYSMRSCRGVGGTWRVRFAVSNFECKK